LDREKKLLEDINSTFRSKEISVEELEKALEDLKSNNIELKEENQKLSQIIDTVKAEPSRLTKFEQEIFNLENKIIDLEIENENLKQKDATLLAKTINVMEQETREQITPTDDLEISEKDLPISAEPEVLNLEEAVPTKPIEETGYRKKICPNCGNTNKAQIREFDDKTRSIFPGFYAKKYKCGQCATEWAK
jgi:myosin heavy subunit